MPDTMPPHDAPWPAATPDCENERGLISVEAARLLLLGGVVPVAGVEDVPLAYASGRVLAVRIAASFPLPPFDRSAVDGYGLGGDGLGPFGLVATVPAGAPGPDWVGSGEAVRLLTGARVPDGIRAVAMQESCRIFASTIMAPQLAPGENIRRRGEDFEIGEQMLPPGMRLDPRHLALLAAAGRGVARVRRRPRVALLSCGDELLRPGDAPRASAVHDSNRPMLAALLTAAGADVVDLGLLPDQRAVIAAALVRDAAGCDAVFASGGVSGSEADHLLGALHDAGGEGAWTAVALKPGKPLVFGRLDTARCLFLPGNPVAALVGALLFARSLVDRLHGVPDRPTRGLPATAAAGWTRRPGREEFAPAVVRDGAPLSVERIGRPGSARLMPLAAADGLVRVRAEAGSVRPGDAVEFFPFGGCFGLG